MFISKTTAAIKRPNVKTGCILSQCCRSCSRCNFSRAAAKERLKSRSLVELNKICQRCFLCKSMSFCPICSKCPTCCHRNQCWGKASEFLASLAKAGCKSQGGVSADGYTLPFRERPHLSRFPLIVSKYSSPVKSKAVLEALASLIQKKAVEKVVVRSSLAFYNHFFLLPKPNIVPALSIFS